jgi:fatty acid desaturase
VSQTIIHWALIGALFTFVAYWPALWSVALACVIIGVNIYGLYIIGHDGLHRRLFPTERANDLWNDIFIVGSYFAITRINRRNHIHHHLVTCLEDDPDRHKYTHPGKELVFPLFFFLTGLANVVPAIRNVFFESTNRASNLIKTNASKRERYKLRDLAILIGWQIVLIGGLTYFIGWWAYPVLWIMPLYVFAYLADLLRVFCEHSMLVHDHQADVSMRLVSFTSSWLEKMFFAPHNMNLHMIHHLWPSIPYYNLPMADQLVRSAAETDERLVWRRSYMGYLIAYFVWRLRVRSCSIA